ncbi:MAG: hypothetical protein H6737_02605 [Alphaproteobacteria bacterium]|nr:hypothetical protein [Alphaproteobacteria bacterium]
MTQWNRRQFGLWTSAAMLLPSQALAGDPTAQAQQVVKPPRGLDAVQLDATFEKADDDGVHYVITAFQPGPKGLSLRYDIGPVSVEDGGQRTDTVIAWLNGNHPFSRRIMAPDFVDLPANEKLEVARLHVAIGPDHRTATARVHAALIFWKGDESRPIDLPPLPVVKPEKTG